MDLATARYPGFNIPVEPVTPPYLVHFRVYHNTHIKSRILLRAIIALWYPHIYFPILYKNIHTKKTRLQKKHFQCDLYCRYLSLLHQILPLIEYHFSAYMPLLLK